MRPAAALAVVSCLLLGGCGGSGGHSTSSAATGGGKTLKELWQAADVSVGVTPGTETYEAGPTRVSFLVIDQHGRPIVRPTARVWVANDLDAAPFLEATARLQRAGVAGGSAAPVGTYYVTHVRLPAAGKYWLLAEPAGGQRLVAALGNVVARQHDSPPDVGDRAIPSDTPTIASTGGDLSKLTTRTPPDVSLLRYSIAGSLKARRPFVVTFATPKFCASRLCGPAVDVTLAAQRRFRGTGIRFIHVEVYEDNDPAKSYNRWMKEWGLETEPWTFLVDARGRVVDRFEGILSLAELESAIRRTLLTR